MEFKKKSVVIQAQQFTGDNWREMLEFIGEKKGFWHEGRLIIHTLEGNMTANPSDWIIKGVKGEFYPCKADIFELTYELDDNTASPIAAWSDIAASAYRAYAASTGNKNYRGEPMPAFEALPTAIQTAWQAAVRQAGRVSCGEPCELGAEQHWAGWVMP